MPGICAGAMILSPTPRERERWYAMLLLAPGVDRLGHGGGAGTGSPHRRPMGRRLRRGRARSLDFRAVRGFPPALGEAQQAALKEAVQELPAKSGIELANWNWKVVHQYVSERFGVTLTRSSCLNYLHRLGFVLKRPKKRLVKADERKRESFVAEYAALWNEARRSGAKIFFADEAHFRADAELRGKWVVKGEPRWWTPAARAMARRPATTRRCAWRPGRWSGWSWRGTATQETSAVFLRQLRERHAGALNVIWDNAPAHRGEAVREFLRDTRPGPAADEPAGLQPGLQRR